MSKVNKVLFIVVVVLLVALLAVLVVRLSNPSGQTITAVYLRTGDLYFGELTTFPSFGLKNPYLLAINQQNQSNPVNIQKFSKIFWGPEDYMKINRDEVVWTANLTPDSNLVKLIQTNPDLIPPQTTSGAQQNGTTPSQPLAPTASSTSK